MRSRKSWSGKTAILISRVGRSRGRELDEIRFLEDFVSQLIFKIRDSILIKKQLKIHLRNIVALVFSRAFVERFFLIRSCAIFTQADGRNEHFFRLLE